MARYIKRVVTGEYKGSNYTYSPFIEIVQELKDGERTVCVIHLIADAYINEIGEAVNELKHAEANTILQALNAAVGD